jgi:uncharacterized protein YkwD
MRRSAIRFLASLTAIALLMPSTGVAAAQTAAAETSLTAQITTEDPYEADASYEAVKPFSDALASLHGASGASSSLTDVAVSGIVYNQSEARKMLSAINEFRTTGDAWYYNADGTRRENIKVGALTYDYGLEEIAMQRAAEVAVSFSHTRPNGTAWSTVQASDESTPSGENLAASIGNTTYTTAHTLLREDNEAYDGQGHRRLMLESSFTAVGVACVRMNGFSYWVEEFGGPTSVSESTALDGTRDAVITITANRIADATDPTTGETYKDAMIYIPDSYAVYPNQSRALPKIHAVIRLKDAYPALGYSASPRLLLDEAPVTWSVQDSSVASVESNALTGIKSGSTELAFTGSIGGIGFSNTVPLVVPENNPISMYRLYNPNSGEHFYTASKSEHDGLVRAGWHDEGTGWKAPSQTDIPVYRLYNPNAGDHHYTMDPDERAMLIRVGWNDEGIGWYSDYTKTTPLYRQYNPNAKAGSHNYTTSKSERDMLIAAGWRDEGISWYGL